MAGAYRISRVEKVGYAPRFWWEIHPHRGQWCRFSELNLNPPVFRETVSPLTKIIEGESLKSFFRKVRDQMAGNPDIITQETDRESTLAFLQQVPEWLEEQKRQVAARPNTDGLRSSPFAGLSLTASPPKPPPLAVNPEKGDAKAESARKGRRVQVPKRLLAAQSPHPGWRPPPAPRHGRGCWRIRHCSSKSNEVYGRSVLNALLSAAASKKIVVLRGLPGTGKSHLARRLLDDPKAERSFVLPVSGPGGAVKTCLAM